MTRNDKSAAEALAKVRDLARDLVDGRTAPYDAGWAMWSAAIGGLVGDRSTDGDHCHALWLLWGGLTDWVEVKPEETTQAEDAMRRAATEWLAVADDEARWRPFFDYWRYTEIGYERPTKGAHDDTTP